MFKKYALEIYIAFAISSIIAIIMMYNVFHLDNTFIFFFGFSTFLFIPLGMIIAYIIYKKAQNSFKNHALIYASRSNKLLYESKLSLTLFKEEEINTNPSEDVEEEYVDKAREIGKKAKELLIAIIVVSIYIGLKLFARAGSFDFLVIELIACVIAGFYFLYFIIFTIDILTQKDEEILFNKEKIQAIKDFDEVDDSIQITDYKIYEKEMFIQIPLENKTTYALISKNKLFVISLNKEQIKNRDELNKNEETKKKEYKMLFKTFDVKKYIIKKKDIVDVLKIVREECLNK